MSIIFHIMKEEYERLLEAERVYRAGIEKEVSGSPRIKSIGNRRYVYLERREGKKVVYQYIAPEGTAKANAVLESVKRRRKFEESLKRILPDLRDVKKVLHGKV